MGTPISLSLACSHTLHPFPPYTHLLVRLGRTLATVGLGKSKERGCKSVPSLVCAQRVMLLSPVTPSPQALLVQDGLHADASLCVLESEQYYCIGNSGRPGAQTNKIRACTSISHTPLSLPDWQPGNRVC